MEQAITTLSSKGQVVIPAFLRQSLGLESGTRFVIRQEGEVLILEPQTVAAKLRKIRELRGLTAGGSSMTDELLEDRRREREAELAKDGW
jgi:AbrB family looped-hinge helix DNA binding protein